MIDAVTAPARVAEGFQAVTFDAALNTTNLWKGPPSDALDEAWEDTIHGKHRLQCTSLPHSPLTRNSRPPSRDCRRAAKDRKDQRRHPLATREVSSKAGSLPPAALPGSHPTIRPQRLLPHG